MKIVQNPRNPLKRFVNPAPGTPFGD